MKLKTLLIAATAASAALLGTQIWRAHARFVQAVPDPLNEIAAQSAPLTPGGAESIVFVPECADAIVVRVDPAADPRGPIHVALALNEPGGRFADGPVFQADARLEDMPADGAWILTPAMPPLRGRFVKTSLRVDPETHGSVLMRAGRSSVDARPNLDQRWSMRPSLIAGARTTEQDPMRCLAHAMPIPRWARPSAAVMLGAVWLCAIVAVGWCLVGGPSRERR